MEEKIKMITAVSKVLEIKRKNPNLTNEEIIKSVSGFIFADKNQTAKIGMMAAASKALEIIDKNPQLNEKEVINDVMKELNALLKDIK